jgi:epoxyqueuosine reductase QueG
VAIFADLLAYVEDRPGDAVASGKFCDSCRACRKFCPADAIPDHRSPDAGQDHLGLDRYIVDTGRCFPYFAAHKYCSICLPVCAYNHKEWARDFEGFQTKIFPTVVMEDPPPPVDPMDASRSHVYVRLHR